MTTCRASWIVLTMKVKNAINFRNNWNFRETGDYELRKVAFENDDHIDRNSRWGRTSFENGFFVLWQSLSFLCFSSTSISTSTLYLYLLFSGRFVVLNSVQSMPFSGSSSIPGRQFSVDLRSDQARPRPVPSIEWQAAKIDSNFLINPTQPTGGLADDEKDDAVNDSDDDHVDDKV